MMGTRKIAIRAMVALLALTLAGVTVASAQQIRRLNMNAQPKGEGTTAEILAPATSFEPERVRTLMLSIHGYTYAQLQSASTNVEDILMEMADDPNELMLVRRQAIKGMRLYPTEPVLQFIEGRVNSSPVGLKRLYLSSLGGFAQSNPARVTPILESALNDSDITVRYAGLNLARKMRAIPAVSTILQSRFDIEADPSLRSQIGSALQSN